MVRSSPYFFGHSDTIRSLGKRIGRSYALQKTTQPVSRLGLAATAKLFLASLLPNSRHWVGLSESSLRPAMCKFDKAGDLRLQRMTAKRAVTAASGPRGEGRLWAVLIRFRRTLYRRCRVASEVGSEPIAVILISCCGRTQHEVLFACIASGAAMSQEERLFVCCVYPSQSDVNGLIGSGSLSHPFVARRCAQQWPPDH